MSSSNFSQRFALLVGVNTYQCDGTRPSANGNPLTLGNLSGCINDVRAIKEFLEQNVRLTTTYVLTSTPSIDSRVPREPPEELPTLKNIERVFQDVAKRASAGDLFIFHFSGHGAQLETIQQSPQDGRKHDSALLTSDYCCGQPAIRGWQLNRWLKKIHDAGVQVVVTLDSCHSGNAWRKDGSARTPDEWIPPPNISVDDVDLEGQFEMPLTEKIVRDGYIGASWDINPDRITLMTACQDDQVAHERLLDGKTYGMFTHSMVQYLWKSRHLVPTYRTLRDQIASRMAGRLVQEPQVFGRDRLMVFDNKEPFFTTPVVSKTEGKFTILPVGRIHGIRRGTEFKPLEPAGSVVFSVDEVDALSCRARHALTGLVHNELAVSRWSIGEQSLTIFVDPKFEAIFVESFTTRIQDLIYGAIKVVRDKAQLSKVGDFQILPHMENGVDITGPEAIVGYQGPVRGLIMKDGSPEQRATKSAAAVAHLIRFGQILSLGDEASSEARPFEVVFDRLNASDEGPLVHDAKVRYKIQNNSCQELFFVLVVLGPGFHVTQLYPGCEFPEAIQPGCAKTLSFQLQIPPELHAYPISTSTQAHRDILRTIVTVERGPSFKMIEIPDIWDSGGPQTSSGISQERTAKLKNVRRSASPFRWWIEDIETRTVFLDS
ncbi:hypothetical protein Neosp_015196 [[Neocosmospora] mangrovei]